VFLENFCTYLLQFPDGSGINDTLNFRVNIQKQARVYYMWGTSYSDAGVKQKGWAETGIRYNIPYPMQGYLILQGTQMLGAEFNIFVWATDNPYNPTPPPPPPLPPGLALDLNE
jgi:hypothetical protein